MWRYINEDYKTCFFCIWFFVEMSSLTTFFLKLFSNDLILLFNWKADATSCWNIQLFSTKNKRMTCVSFVIKTSKHFEKCNNQRVVSNKHRFSFAYFSVVSFTKEKRNKSKKYFFIVIQSFSSWKMNLNRS